MLDEALTDAFSRVATATKIRAVHIRCGHTFLFRGELYSCIASSMDSAGRMMGITAIAHEDVEREPFRITIVRLPVNMEISVVDQIIIEMRVISSTDELPEQAKDSGNEIPTSMGGA